MNRSLFIVHRFCGAAVLALLIALLIALPAVGQATLPATPAGARLGELLALWQQNDAAAHERYLKDHFAAAEQADLADHKDFFRQIAVMHGGFTLASVASSEPHRLVAMLESRQRPGAMRRVTVAVDPAPPHKVTGWDIEMAGGQGGGQGNQVQRETGGQGNQIVRETGGQGERVIREAAGAGGAAPDLGGYHTKWGLPESPGGQRTAHLLETLERNDPAFTRAFLETALAPAFLATASMDEHLRRFDEISRQLGSFTFVSANRMNSIEVVVQDATDAAHLITLWLETNAPYKITSFNVGPHTPPEPPPPFNTLADIEAHFDGLARDDAFSGVLYIAQGGKPILQKAYGYADRDARRPNRIDTRFNIGSITKLFTRLAIARLVRDGQVALDAPIARYLPAFDNEVGRKVKVIDLLYFQSGLKEFFTLDAFQNRTAPWLAHDDYVQALKDQPLDYEPGTRQAYNNAGYAVLGALIEAVTGAAYYDYVQTYFFEPAGVTSFSFTPHAQIGPETAVSYTRGGDGWVSAHGAMGDRGIAAGGSYATAADLHTFFDAMLNLKLLDEHHTALAIHDFAEDARMPTTIGEAGGGPGVMALVEWDKARDLYVILLMNQDGGGAERLGTSLSESPALR